MRIVCPTLLIACLLTSAVCAQGNSSPGSFIVRKGDKLYDGEKEFRFISFNIPNLHYVEDDLRFAQPIPFRWPDAYEIEDALEAVRQMGGQVARTYTLSVRKADDPQGMPRHVLAPGQFDEQAFQTLDTVLDVARRKGIRLIIPFVDNWKWWGGVAQYAAFRDKGEKEFWSDPQLKNDIKGTIRFVLTRVNTKNGITYRDDPTILAWETGNELSCTHEWTREMAAYIKELDSKHLVLDGKSGRVLEEQSIDNPYVDFIQTHHYERDPRQMIAHIRQSAAMARGKKPYHVGEFGFLSTDALQAVMDTIIEEDVVGGLGWSLRYHSRDGGFFWHHEPAGGDFFKAYHWPGFNSGEAYDETRLLTIMRAKAFAIRGMEAPAPPAPAAPAMISVSPGGLVTWRGSAGASGYDIQRSHNSSGPWTTIGHNVSDARVQYRPLFTDESAEPGQNHHYRIVARNSSGLSNPSAVYGPVRITHNTLVDELWNEGRFFHKRGRLEFRNNQARKFKEDAHRLAGERGASIIYRVPKSLVGAKLYVFAETDGDHLKIEISEDGQQFRTVEADPEILAAGDAKTYGFWLPILYRVGDLSGDTRYLRLEFLSDAQLSRVELSYGEN